MKDWVNMNVWLPVEPFWQKVSEFFPKLIGALIALLVGWFLAIFISRLIVKFFKLIKIDFWMEKLRIDAFLAEGGVKLKSMEVLEKTIYWLLMFCVFLMALNILDVKGASELFNKFIEFIPNVVIAIAVLVIGLFVARVAQNALLAYLKNIGAGNAETASKLAQWAIVIFTLLIVLDQLKIAGFVVQLVSYAVMGVCLAFGLAFGLGGKEWASGVIQKLTQKK
jgi:hypothetical protein